MLEEAVVLYIGTKATSMASVHLNWYVGQFSCIRISFTQR